MDRLLNRFNQKSSVITVNKATSVSSSSSSSSSSSNSSQLCQKCKNCCKRCGQELEQPKPVIISDISNNNVSN